MSPTHCDTVFSPARKNSQEKAPRMLVANWGQRQLRKTARTTLLLCSYYIVKQKGPQGSFLPI